jgi:hypothetical protein
LCQQRRKLDAAVPGREGFQAPDGLGELSFGTDPASASCLVPRDRDVDEPLEEVALLCRRRAPGILELLVRGEVLARADQLEPGLKRGL